MATSWRWRMKAAGAHMALSAVVIGFIALGMFHVWYPEPFRSLSGGLNLFFLVALVDLVLGPGATLVVSSPGKPKREWRTDVGLIVLIQLAALAYGVWTVYQARPVFLAFEIDRFRAVHAVEVPLELLDRAPPGARVLSLLGPGMVAVRPFVDAKEEADATMAALGGVHLGARPDLWMAYEDSVPKVLAVARPVRELLDRRSDAREAWVRSPALESLNADEVLYLPLVGRTSFWTILLDRHNAQPVGYLPVDPYDP
ncbi:MAG: pilus assembly protein [Hydrogenophaga sp.]|uniref:TfpX/TfpZ family type IV pilin accessory protein n=1 Tax=Hydrogenophaga sp. TaxID=1904254 RepID=UPI00261791F3|nr:TfpX/TfpZ family type IV pilin accessory protein [Hydrogenophaga sp.]MCV0438601.1 pilus assembly protein [Hydrogenophaga sp.]